MGVCGFASAACFANLNMPSKPCGCSKTGACQSTGSHHPAQGSATAAIGSSSPIWNDATHPSMPRPVTGRTPLNSARHARRGPLRSPEAQRLLLRRYGTSRKTRQPLQCLQTHLSECTRRVCLSSVAVPADGVTTFFWIKRRARPEKSPAGRGHSATLMRRWVYAVMGKPVS